MPIFIGFPVESERHRTPWNVAQLLINVVAVKEVTHSDGRSWDDVTTLHVAPESVRRQGTV